MYEQLLARLLQSVNLALAQRNHAAAIEHCTKALRLCDEAWGPRSLHRALVLVPMARAHEANNASDPAIQALTEAATILQAHPDELPIENLAHVCDKLVSLLTGVDKFVESEKWAMLAVQTRQDEMLQDPGVPLIAEKYGAACASVGIVESRLGKFVQAEKYFSDGLKIFYDVLPLSQNCARTLEYYTSCLHQQGKTEAAITALEQYERVITGEPGNSLALCKAWRRSATLLFTIAEWSRCETLLTKAEQEEKKSGHPADLQALCDLAAVYWEMGDETKALEKETQLRECKVSAFQFQLLPTTRSDLLSTLDCQLLQGKYKLELRINRTRPMRKEGEPLEDPEKVPRKIARCFIDATFENTDPNEPAVVMSQEMPSFSLMLESPTLKEAKIDAWYKVTLVVYEDATRAKKIGAHHQLVYALNPQFASSSSLALH
jgi:tetratricopeptide (TPR) repeat protein